MIDGPSLREPLSTGNLPNFPRTRRLPVRLTRLGKARLSGTVTDRASPKMSALVEKLAADSATLTLVNTNPIAAREINVQAGGYGEHRFDAITVGGKTTEFHGPVVTVRLDPGAGSRLEFKMTRYANRPTLAFPWDRGWYPAR
jgi:hypothetical protein